MNLLGLYSQKEVIVPIRNRKNASPTKEKFTGKERDSETGLDYFGARYYDSSIGRWLSADPLADKYPHASPYNYVLNNPMGFVDPDGKMVEECCDYIFQADGSYQEIKTPDNQNSRYFYQNEGSLAGFSIANVAAMVYVEMTQGSYNDKQVVAEIIRNRIVVSNEYAHENHGKPWYKGQMEYGKDVHAVLYAKGSTGESHFQAFDKEATYQKYIDAKNGKFSNASERNAFVESLSASIKAFNLKTNLADNATQYNSPRRSPNDLSKNAAYQVTYPDNYSSLSRSNMNIMAVRYADASNKGMSYNGYLNAFFNSNNSVNFRGKYSNEYDKKK